MLSDAKAIAKLVREVSPDILVCFIILKTSAHADNCNKVVMDAVCSVASEEIRQDEWSIDVVLSATQKGLGTPPGLSVLSASQRAIQVTVCPLQYMVSI